MPCKKSLRSYIKTHHNAIFGKQKVRIQSWRIYINREECVHLAFEVLVRDQPLWRKHEGRCLMSPSHPLSLPWGGGWGGLLIPCWRANCRSSRIAAGGAPCASNRRPGGLASICDMVLWLPLWWLPSQGLSTTPCFVFAWYGVGCVPFFCLPSLPSFLPAFLSPLPSIFPSIFPFHPSSRKADKFLASTSFLVESKHTQWLSFLCLIASMWVLNFLVIWFGRWGNRYFESKWPDSG